jgi:hypothetical protein
MKLHISRLLLASTIAICILLTAPAALQAAPVGTFTTAAQGNVRVGPTFIDWGLLNPGGNPTFDVTTLAQATACANDTAGCPITAGAPTYGNVFIDTATGDFSPFQATSLSAPFHMIRDLESSFAPVNTPISVDDFLIIQGSAFDFTLTEILPGTGTAAGCTSNPGDVCTPAGSPFTITNLPGNRSQVGFAVNGLVSDGTPGSSDFTATFTVTFDNQTAASLLAEIVANGWVQSSHSGDWTVTAQPIPAPPAVALLGGGMLLVLVSRFRRRKLS